MGIKNSAPLIHGGDIYRASREFGKAPEDWLDLSTGINPRSYTFDALKTRDMARLPYLRPDFIQAAARYYGSGYFAAVAGTQWSIALLPDALTALSPVRRVLVPELGYCEHAQQWRARGAELVVYPSHDAQAMGETIQQTLQHQPDTHLVVINPNNPTAVTVSEDAIKRWRALQSPAARLIVDEAFMDAVPQRSFLQAFAPDAGVIVLRSFGKFFGLAGLRLGFVFAERALLDAINKAQGVWAINGPAQALATAAFADVAWQSTARRLLEDDCACTRAMFRPLLGAASMQSALFSVYAMTPHEAQSHYQHLAGHGILTRVVPWREDVSLLRLGLLRADDESARARVRAAVRVL